jgi:hypothetical protein
MRRRITNLSKLQQGVNKNGGGTGASDEKDLTISDPTYPAACDPAYHVISLREETG